MLVYIKPLSIFPELHSDTIFGAILSAVSELYPKKVEELLSKFENNPPFLVSSSFPYVSNGKEKIRFFPKIIESKNKRSKNDLKKNGFPDENLDNNKKYKKIDFIEEDLFFKLASGDIKESDIINNLENYNIKSNLLFKNTIDITGKYKKTITPNNTINRITLESEAIFYSEGFEFSNMGLFFLVDFRENKYEDIVCSAIRFLKDRGFGRDISTGKGHFDYEIDTDYNLLENKGNYFITLSRFIPNNEDISKINEHSGYEIDSKRGKSSSGELRKQVRFFKEGSSFPNYKEFYGKIVESGKDSPAVEYGYAFPMNYNKRDD
ncbi:MAG: type III-A CRISPR-associated RAMP protein Csm4 [Methanobacteriaceae archaeon]|jgi:CRISPR-associated protein Csm4|nr:type III-A CRISPR-associated RAMP protein Csm4 [Candidatus Methanorudis spinitermitis]